MNISRTTEQIPISLFRVARDRQSYTNMLYLLLSFPLGLFYFVFLITGIVVGIVTLVIWIGVPILILMMAAWWYMAAFERHMAIDWLHVAIPPLSLSDAWPTGITRWQKLQVHLSNSMTWKTLAYLLLKFPLGIFSFLATIIMPVLSVVVAIVSLIIWLVTSPFIILFMIILGTPDTGERLRQYFRFALTGFGLSSHAPPAQWACIHLGADCTFNAWHERCSNAPRTSKGDGGAGTSKSRAGRAAQTRPGRQRRTSHEHQLPAFLGIWNHYSWRRKAEQYLYLRPG